MRLIYSVSLGIGFTILGASFSFASSSVVMSWGERAPCLPIAFEQPYWGQVEYLYCRSERLEIVLIGNSESLARNGYWIHPWNGELEFSRFLRSGLDEWVQNAEMGQTWVLSAQNEFLSGAASELREANRIVRFGKDQRWAFLFKNLLESLQRRRAQIEWVLLNTRRVLLHVIDEASNSNYTTICERGKSWRDQSCKLFTCQVLRISDIDFDPLLLFPSHPADLPQITLSNGHQVGPTVKVTQIFAWEEEHFGLPLYEARPEENVFFGDDHRFDPPEVLLHDHFSKEFQSQRNQGESCKDWELSRILIQHNNALQYLKKSISRIEVVQWIRIEDQQFHSRFLARGFMPMSFVRCFGSVYAENHEVCSEFVKFTNKFGSLKESVQNEEFLVAAQKVSQMTDLCVNSLVDGCTERAHLIGFRLDDMGVSNRKIAVAGGISLIRSPDVRWSFHVAPYIPVQSSHGLVAMKIMDPALSKYPLSVQGWLNRFYLEGPLVRVVYPLPDNAKQYQRVAFAYFSNAFSSVFSCNVEGEEIEEYLPAAVQYNRELKYSE